MAINVSTWSIRNPIPATLLFIMLTLAGLVGFRAMKVQQFPDIDLPTVTVTAVLPGAAPAQLETEVVRKIENQLATLQDVNRLFHSHEDRPDCIGAAQVMKQLVTDVAGVEIRE